MTHLSIVVPNETTFVEPVAQFAPMEMATGR
jgi:hypothetical protein